MINKTFSDLPVQSKKLYIAFERIALFYLWNVHRIAKINGLAD